jgi:anti-sigma factor RsiW
MSHTFQCGDNTALVSYLYDESDPAERAAIDAHVTLCAACAAELAALESARLQLTSWTPPGADLGFQIVRPQASGPEPQTAAAVGLRPGAYRRAVHWVSRPLPAWAQAVAACLIFAAGLSLGVVRGSMPTASPAVATTGAAPAAPPTAASSTELAALEGRMRAQMAQLRTTAVNSGATAPQGISEAQLLARVRTLIEESEQRQQRELALRTAQVVRDFDSQRKVDLAQIQRSFGQIEGLAGAEVREQRQMLNYLMRVSEQR